MAYINTIICLIRSHRTMFKLGQHLVFRHNSKVMLLYCGKKSLPQICVLSVSWLAIIDIPNHKTISDKFMCIFCADTGHTTKVVNLTDGSSLIRSSHTEGTTEATLYNVTAMMSLSANLNNSASLRNESYVMDNTTDTVPRYLEFCPSRVRCDKLGADCIDCELNSTCQYGANISAACRVKPQIICLVCCTLLAL